MVSRSFTPDAPTDKSTFCSSYIWAKMIKQLMHKDKNHSHKQPTISGNSAQMR